MTALTTARDFRPATPEQLRFLNTLRVERGLAPVDRADWDARGLSTRDASRQIDQTKALPRVARPAPTAGGGGWLTHLPLSKYALVEDDVMTFWEVREYQGRRYIRLLVGAPGAFRRVKVNFDRARRIADTIRANPLTAAQAFATHYTCCAVCGADLSDPTSVALGLGPICRQRFGL